MSPLRWKTQSFHSPKFLQAMERKVSKNQEGPLEGKLGWFRGFGSSGFLPSLILTNQDEPTVPLFLSPLAPQLSGQAVTPVT